LEPVEEGSNSGMAKFGRVAGISLIGVGSDRHPRAG